MMMKMHAKKKRSFLPKNNAFINLKALFEMNEKKGDDA